MRSHWTSVCLFVPVVVLVSFGGGCADESPSSSKQHGDTDIIVLPDPDAGTNVNNDNNDDDAGITPQPDVATTDVPEIDLPTVAAGIDTVVAPEVVEVGAALNVTCQFVDTDGQAISVPEGANVDVVVAPETSFLALEDEQWAPTRTGEATVACRSAPLSLIDPEPAVITVVPGPAHTVLTELDTYQVTAGSTVTATCAVFDQYGNVVDDAQTTLTVTPSGDGIEVVGHEVGITAAGVYSVTCEADGAAENRGQTLEVLPDLPAGLIVARDPDQEVHAIGDVVGVTWTVVDQYGNVVTTADVRTSSQPFEPPFADGRFRFDEEGEYEVTVRVEGDTHGDVELSETVTFAIGGEGPSITCESPSPGSMENHTPGNNITFTGRVADANGVDSVTVNGQSVSVGSDGRFSTSLDTEFGINFVDVVATDEFGQANSRTCSYLVANQWAPETSYLDDGVSLKLRQSGVDDGNRSGSLGSLGEVLARALNSDGLEDALDDALSDANPLKPSACDSETCTFLGCVCWLRSEVTYISESVGSRTVGLDLISGGLEADARVNNVTVRVRVRGHVSGIPYDTTGNVTVSYIQIDNLRLGASLQNNQPRVSITSPGVVSVGSVSTSFSGLDGAIINIVVSLFNGSVRNLIRDEIRNFIQGNFDQVLDGVLGGLDINSLGTAFFVPRLDGSGTVRLGVGIRFSSLTTSSSRMLFGLGTRFTTTITEGGSTRGAAIPPGTIRDDPGGTQDIAASVNIGVLNQALHTLWRGGMFRVTLDSDDIGGTFPDGARASLDTNLPPVAAYGGSNRIELSIGGVGADIIYPGIFNQPIHVEIGARARADISLDGNDLRFESVTITELFFSTDEVTLDDNTRSILEEFFAALLQDVIDNSLNDALPALPIPEFTTPSSLSQFDIPTGTVLGIVNPSLSNDQRHFVLQGGLGEL